MSLAMFDFTMSNPRFLKNFRPGSLLLCASVGLFFVACKPATPPTPPPAMETFETKRVETALAGYRKSPSEATKAEVDRALAEMESEISELDVRSSKVSGADKAETDRKASDLRAKHNHYRADFAAAQAEVGAKSIGEKTEETLKKAGDATERAVEKTGDAIKDAAESVGDALNPNR